MLKFDESERPSFIELAKLVLTSEDNTLNTPKLDEVHGGHIKTPVTHSGLNKNIEHNERARSAPKENLTKEDST